MALLKNKYIQIFGALIIYSFVGVMAKLAALSASKICFFVFATLEVVILGIYALIWQQLLKKFSVVVAMSFKGIVIILSLVWAALFFNEQISFHHIIGSIVIIAGILVVSKNE